MTNEQAAALRTNHSVWAWHQNVLTSYDWLEATVTKEPDMNLLDVVVDVWIQDPPPGSRSHKTASHLEDRDPARRRTDRRRLKFSLEREGVREPARDANR